MACTPHPNWMFKDFGKCSVRECQKMFILVGEGVFLWGAQKQKVCDSAVLIIER